MSRYYALVLVPGETSKEAACDAALDLLYPYMRTGRGKPAEDFKFDYLYGPEDIADLTDDDVTQNMRRVGDVLDTLVELQVEAILTPEGIWHETEPGQL